MGIREQLDKSPKRTAIVAGVFMLAACALLAHTYWPERKADLNQAFYSDDDGQTWFADSAFKVAPFDHNGKQAVIAQVYTYDDGKKQFCGYLSRYTPAAKGELEKAIADAQQHGQSPATVSLYHDRSFIQQGMQAKKPGAGPWVPYTDSHINEVFSIQSPDGSAVDQLFTY